MKALTIFYKVAAIFAIAAFATSCTDKIELDLPDGESFLVVEGFITNTDKSHEIKLTYTSPYFDDAPQPKATGANVIVRDNDGVETVLEENQPGVYTFEGPGEIGKSYQLEIMLTDGGHFKSSFEQLASVVQIDDIYYQLSEDEPDEDDDQDPTDIYEVIITTVEPVGVGDYYRWRGFKNGIEYTSPYDIFVASDEFVDGNPIDDFNVTDDLYSIGDTVLIIQEHIQRSQFEFMNLLVSQTADVGGPFDSPPAPVLGNIVDQNNPDKIVLGYFGTAGQAQAQVVIGE